MQRVKLVHGYLAHTLYDLAGVEMFFLTWGPALFECYGPRATLIRHWVYICTVSTEWVKQLNPELDKRFVLSLYDSCVICA